jgi:hypothetical protein
MHYSSQAALARKQAIAEREDNFTAFMNSVSLDDVVATAQDVLAPACVPAKIANETLAKLKSFKLTRSRQQLMFNYKVDFEALRSASIVPGAV